jgi:hypothetical protein
MLTKLANMTCRYEWKLPNSDKDVVTSITEDISEAFKPDHDDQVYEDGIQIVPSDPEIQDLVKRQYKGFDDHAAFRAIFLQTIPQNTPAWKRNLFMTCKLPLRSSESSP